MSAASASLQRYSRKQRQVKCTPRRQMENPYSYGQYQNPYGSQQPYAQQPAGNPEMGYGPSAYGAPSAPPYYHSTPSQAPGGIPQYGHQRMAGGQQSGGAPQQQFTPSGTVDPLMAGIQATRYFKEAGSQFQGAQQFVSSRLDFIRGEGLHYYFQLNHSYILSKLLLLLTPYLARWSFTRHVDNVGSTARPLPPARDLAAPDLYIPFMAAGTYAYLLSLTTLLAGKFSPLDVYSHISKAVGLWVAHWVIVRLMIWWLRLHNPPPELETVAIAGYGFFPACVSLVLKSLRKGKPALWGWPLTVWVLYAALSMAVFMTRTVKRVIFAETQQFGEQRMRNYVLLGLAVLQLPVQYVLYIVA